MKNELKAFLASDGAMEPGDAAKIALNKSIRLTPVVKKAMIGLGEAGQNLSETLGQ